MEELQKKYISANLPSLIQKTRCTPLLLSHLTSKDIIGDGDVEQVKAQLTPTAKANKLYEILMTRIDAYDTLIEAVKMDGQTGALCTLNMEMSWSEYSDKVKNLLLDQKLSFQDNDMMFKDVLENVCNEFYNKHVRGQLLLELMKGKCPQIVINSIPALPTYYIERAIEAQHQVSHKIFNFDCLDVIVVKGIELHQLTQLGAQGADTSTNQFEELTTRFIVLDHDHHFEEISKKSRNPVHLLKHENGIFIWIKSNGTITTIQKHTEDQLDEMDEDLFINICLNSSEPICIADTPGMGKSVFLAKIARKIKEHFPRRICVFVGLRELLPEIGNLGKEISFNKIAHHLAAQTSTYSLGQELVQLRLESEKEISYLFLDGFDEIEHEFLPVAKRLFEILKGQKNIRLFVTTRPHLRVEVEKLIIGIGFTMKPFQEEHQVRFLVHYWTQALPTALCYQNLRNFAKHSINDVRGDMSDFERNIFGIPLQCRLLAEVHMENAKIIIEDESVPFDTLPTVTTVFEMCSKFMENCFKRYEYETRERSYLNTFFRKKSKFIKRMIFAHTYHALKEIFPSNASEFEDFLLFSHKPDKTQLQLFNAGIIEKKQIKSLLGFVHRMFAEYLVALFIIKVSSEGAPPARVKSVMAQADKLRQLPMSRLIRGQFVFRSRLFGNSRTMLNTWEMLLQHVLSTDSKLESILGKEEEYANPVASANLKHPVICYFIDMMMKEMEEKFEFYGLAELGPKFYIINAYIGATVAGFRNIALAILKLILGANRIMYLEPTKISDQLLLTAKHSTFEVMDNLYAATSKLEHKAKYPTIQLNSVPTEFAITELHVAMKYGKYSFVVDLLEKRGFRKTLESSSNNIHCLFHLCVVGSSEEPNNIVNQKIQIVKLFSQNYALKCFLNEEIPGGNVPILMSNVHVEIVKCLVNEGADCKHVNGKREGILHIAARDGNLDVIKYIVESGLVDVNAIDGQGNTPLHSATNRRNSEQEEIQKILIHAGANLSSPNSNNSTPIMQALKYGKGISVRVIQEMEERGVSTSMEIASSLLEGLLRNTNIMAWEWDQELISVVEYLMRRGGTFDVDLTKSQTKFGEISKLVCDLMRSGHLDEGSFRISSHSQPVSAEEIDLLLKVPGAYGKLMISLLESKQMKPFLLMQKFLKRPPDSRRIFVTAPPGINDFLTTNDSFLHVLITKDVDGSILRLQETIDSNINVIDLSKVTGLDTYQNEYGLSVLTKNHNDICNLFSQLNRSDKNLHKFIYVTCETPEFSELKESGFPMTKDIITVDDLHESIQKKLEISVGGGAYYEQLKQSQSETTISHTFISRFNDYWREYRTPRSCIQPRLARRNIIPEKIFNYNFLPAEVVCFRDIPYEQLVSMARSDKKIVKSSELTANFNKEYVLLDNDTDFNAICNQTSKAVHLVEFTKTGAFKLVQSNSKNDGAYKFYNFLQPSDSDIVDLRTQLNSRNDNSLLILVDTFKEMMDVRVSITERNTLFTNDTDLLQSIRTKLKSSGYNARVVYELIGEMFLGGVVTRVPELLLRDVWGGFKVVIECINTFSSNDMYIISRFIRAVQRVFKHVRVVLVTCVRKASVEYYDRYEFSLEQALRVVGYEVLPMVRDVKINSIVKYLDQGQDDVSAFADVCLTAYESQVLEQMPVWSEQLVRTHSKLFHLPLLHPLSDPNFYCPLLAKCCQSKCPTINTFDSDTIQITSLIRLLEMHISSHVSDLDTTESILQLAVAHAFPDSLKIFIHVNSISDTSVLITTGLVITNQNGELVFEWELLDLFFVARLLVYRTNYVQKQRFYSFVKMLLGKLGNSINYSLFSVESSRLFWFVDSLLENSGADYFVENVRNSKIAENDLIKCVSACIMARYLNILRALLSAHPSPPRDIITKDMVADAVKTADVQTVAFLCGETNFAHNSQELIEWAVQRGDLAVFKYLANVKAYDTKHLIHKCVYNSLTDSDHVIDHKIQIIKLLVDTDNQCVNNKDVNGETPLHMGSVHLKLYKVIISLGGDVNAKRIYTKTTVLHHAFEYLTPPEYHELVEYLVSLQKTDCFRIRDRLGRRALWRI